MWAEQLNAEIDHKCTRKILSADVVYIEHGANFGGTLNLFGGASEDIYDKLNIITACPDVISLGWKMPNYGAMLKKRVGVPSTYREISETWCNMLSKRFDKTESIMQENLPFADACIGDSHALAFSDRLQKVFKNDGKTLFGALKAGLSTLLRGTFPDNLIWSLGSIDIRHHILRHDNFPLEDFIKEYVKQGDKLGNDVRYCYPVPVEFEGRRIPKSGFYKKTPFFGSYAERKELTEKFIDVLVKQVGNRVVAPPEDWYTMDPELYAKTYMEHGSSFHIAPPYYHKHNWGKSKLVT
jgi:hypothetical protein